MAAQQAVAAAVGRPVRGLPLASAAERRYVELARLFAMTILRIEPFGPIDSDALESFERSLPGPLPDDFRRFLREFNGAVLDCSQFREVPGATALYHVFGLHFGPPYLRLDEAVRMSAEFVPSTVLVFGDDPDGNYFGMLLVGPDHGSIYFIDHERLSTAVAELQRVADSFTQLLHLAGSDLAPATSPNTVSEAIASGDLGALEVFLRGGAAPSGHLFEAVHHGDLRLVRALLDAGANPDERGGIGGSETPLFLAARNDRADVAELLLSRGADANARHDDGGAAVEMAAPWDAVLRVFVAAGAQPTTRRLEAEFERIRRGG